MQDKLIKFLNVIAEFVLEYFPDFTGSVTIHIKDGKIGSYEKKEAGRFQKKEAGKFQ